jgi:hypothetical protein
MDERDPQSNPKLSKPKPGRAAPPVDPREARLAKALRDNLRRRKQARSLGGSGATDEAAPPLTPLADD